MTIVNTTKRVRWINATTAIDVKKHEAHHLDNRYTSSDDESPNIDEKTVVSGGQSSPESDDEDNFAVAIEEPPAKN